jgi:Na+/H+-dicarboxylate symporter
MAHKKLTRNIFIALILGVLVGVTLPDAAPYVSWLGRIFKLSLAMIVMPIILTSILDGMSNMADVGKMERLGAKTFAYFVVTTFIAIFVGLALVVTIKPGVREPSPEISRTISAVVIDPNANASSQITKAISDSMNGSFKESSKVQLETALSGLAEAGHSHDELKMAAQNFMGALPIREKLSNSDGLQSPKPMSPGAFLNAQIDKTLVNPFHALSTTNVLAVILFAIFFGASLAKLGEQGKKVLELVRTCNQALIRIVHLIMAFAPFGVFGLLVDVISSTSAHVLVDLSWYALVVLSGLLIHTAVILPAIMYVVTRVTPRQFFGATKEALAVAFSTSSSNATLPVTIANVEENLNIDRRITRFVLPLGATINLNGTALYEAVGAVFIAQLYGVGLSLSGQILIALTAAMAAMGAAGIPAAGSVTMALVLSAVGLPLEGVGLLLAIDRPLDMCRTAANVMADAISAVVLATFGKNDLAPNLPETDA